MGELKANFTPLFGRVALPRSRVAAATPCRTPVGKLAAFKKSSPPSPWLDPRAGRGNFLYVSLQLLLGLEKEVVTFATQLDFPSSRK